jgi:hypothetical protein
MSLPPLSRLGAAALYPAHRLPLVAVRDRIAWCRYQFVFGISLVVERCR